MCLRSSAPCGAENTTVSFDRFRSGLCRHGTRGELDDTHDLIERFPVMADTPANSRRAAIGPLRRAAVLPWVFLAVATGVVVTVLAPASLLTIVLDGGLVGGVFLAAAGWGLWPVRWLGVGPAPPAQRICVSSALGLGVLSVLTLALGIAGWLSPWVARATLAVGWGLLLERGWAAWRREPAGPRGGGRGMEAARAGPVSDEGVRPRGLTPRAARNSFAGHGARDWSAGLRCLALLPLCVPLGVALFGATLPPGVVWSGEARGYDALEYHLQAPREYVDLGRIAFLPHNVYASFPQQVEMLYLLLMQVRGAVLEAAVACQLLHVGLGVLAVVALGAWTAPGWPRVVVVLLAGSAPWLAYLGCLAYVELGMVFFAAVATGLVLEHFRGDVRCGWRLTLAAGLCAGLAAGCKYTAVALVPACLAAAWLLTQRGGPRTRFARGAVFALGALAAFSPWLVRNAALAGNPVYPFAYEWFGGRAWSAEQAEQWDRGHKLRDDQDRLAGRARILADELFRSGMFGTALWVLPLLGLAVRRSRAQGLLVGWLLLMVLLWTTATHMPGRFAVTIIVPLALLAGSAGQWDGAGGSAAGRTSAVRRAALPALVVLATLGAVANAGTILRLLDAEARRWYADTGRRLADFVDRPDLLRAAQPINRLIPAHAARVWLVGEARAFYLPAQVHYTVVFNRDPWLAYAADHPDPAACVAWLRTQAVTHVVFSWPEIHRLRRTYGFSPLVTREWVARLTQAGLRRIEPPEGPEPMGLEVYEVGPP